MALQAEVKALGGKPAEDAVQPTAVKPDAIKTGEEEEVDNFATSVDAEYKRIWG